MTLTTKIICDECQAIINAQDSKLVLSYESYSFGYTMHFCGHECIKKYLIKKWEEMDKPIVDSE